MIKIYVDNNLKLLEKFYKNKKFKKIMTEDKELSEKSDKLAKEKRGFYIHFIIYLIVNIFLSLQW